jgi:hypothetical protein
VGLVNVGLAIAGDVPSTFAPDPVEVVAPVPPDVTGKAVVSGEVNPDESIVLTAIIIPLDI